jgi:hypothetical protein
MTAQENIARLPKQCYGKLLIDNSIIIIKAGESGFYNVKSQPNLRGQSVDEFIDSANKSDGVTVQQRKAMEWGSQFGWNLPLAMPEKYDENGKIKR